MMKYLDAHVISDHKAIHIPPAKFHDVLAMGVGKTFTIRHTFLSVDSYFSLDDVIFTTNTKYRHYDMMLTVLKNNQR